MSHTSNIDEHLEKAINSVDDGRSILVLGAGFSLGAKNINDERMPSANDLAKILSRELGEDEEIGLEEISGLYLDEKGPAELLNLLKKMFTCKEHTRYQEIISNIPWKRVYTTNYDNVIQKSQDKNKNIETLDRSSDPRKLDNSCCCIHLNGYIKNVNEENFNQKIKITDVQYLSQELGDSPWAGRMRADFHSARNIFFVGYSLYDFDISKILIEGNLNVKKIFFIQDQELRRSKIIKFKRFGKLYQIGVEKFSELLESREKNKDENLKHGFLANFSEYDLKDIQPKEPKIDDMKPLFSKGIVDLNCLAWDIAQQSQKYRVYRPEIERVSPELIDLGSTIMLTGDIGSGKKFLLDEFVSRFNQSNFKCFYFDGLSDYLSDDIEYLAHASTKNPILIVFPDYYSRENLLNLVRFGVPKAVLITTSTIAALELSRTKPFGVRDVITLNLSRLCEKEVEGWDNLLNSYALWGNRAGYSPIKRKKFIESDCNARLRDLMLFLFGQEKIRLEIKDVFEDAKNSGLEARAQLVKYLAISASGHDPSFAEIMEILGRQFVQTINKGQAKWTRELLIVENGRKKVTSSIFAQYLLREFVSDREVIDELAELTTQLDRASLGNKIFSKIRNFPKRYSFIERLFRDKGKQEKLVEYYEELRRRDLGTSDPQFWLQYAIARMSFRDYSIAKDLFETAYANADGMTSYDTYQIDNHYARFLLESSIENADWGNAWENFRNAHRILIKQMGSKKQGHYPYRVASSYLDFIEKFQNEMSGEDISDFIDSCDEVEGFAKELKGDITRNRYINDCKHTIKRAVEYAEEMK